MLWGGDSEKSHYLGNQNCQLRIAFYHPLTKDRPQLYRLNRPNNIPANFERVSINAMVLTWFYLKTTDVLRRRKRFYSSTNPYARALVNFQVSVVASDEIAHLSFRNPVAAQDNVALRTAPDENFQLLERDGLLRAGIHIVNCALHLELTFHQSI